MIVREEGRGGGRVVENTRWQKPEEPVKLIAEVIM